MRSSWKGVKAVAVYPAKKIPKEQFEALREECGTDLPDAHQLVGGIYHSAELFLIIAKDLLGMGRWVEELFGLRVLHPFGLRPLASWHPQGP
jgi:hypothetical protein